MKFLYEVTHFDKETGKVNSFSHTIVAKSRKRAFRHFFAKIDEILDDPEWDDPELHLHHEGGCRLLYTIEDDSVKMTILFKDMQA